MSVGSRRNYLQDISSCISGFSIISNFWSRLWLFSRDLRAFVISSRFTHRAWENLSLAISSQTKMPTLPKMNSPEKFSKRRLFQMIGLLDRKFNHKTLQLERSLSLRLWCYLDLISKLIWPLKFFVCCFFPKHSVIQLYVGSVFNYLPEAPQFYLGIAGIITGNPRVHIVNFTLIKLLINSR